MSQLIPERFFTDTLLSLEQCLIKQLADAKGPAPCYTGIAFGVNNPALGVLTQGCGGVAWIRPSQISPGTFPAADSIAEVDDRLTMQLEIGVARGYPAAGRGAMYPDPAEVRQTMLLVMSDAQRARAAVVCCKQAGADRRWALGSWNPLPADGLVAGGSWTAWVGVQ